MTDPFSIIVGTAGLLDVSWRVISYLKNVNAAAATVEKEITALLQELYSLVSVNESIGKIWAAEGKASFGLSSPDSGRLEALWRQTGEILKECRAVVETLAVLVIEISGKHGPTVVGKMDGIKKQLRKQSKAEDLHELRLRLTTYQQSLQLLLTTLNISYTCRTDLSLGHLSEDLQRLRFELLSQIESLRPRLTTTDGKNLHGSVASAAAVASMVSMSKHFFIPQTLSSIYTGRETLLEELKSAFDVTSFPNHNSTQKRFVIYGLAGSGKTQFCCKFAQENRDNFWGVFWVDASSDENAKHTFSRIAKIAGVEPNERAAKNWLSGLEHPWLLIIDNADDPSMSLDEYFPEGERGYILVTTRNPSNRVHGTVGPQFYNFAELESNAANILLLRAACGPSPWSSSTINSAANIAKTLGFLPLALIQAGTAIRNGLCTLENYLDYYKWNWQRIRRARNASGYRGDQKINMNVFSSYEINYQGLEAQQTQESHDAVELLKMFSFLYFKSIGISILSKAKMNPREEREQEEKERREQKSSTLAAKPKPWIPFLKDLGLGVLQALLADRSLPVLPAVLRASDESVTLDDLRLRLALKELIQMSIITHHVTTDSYSMHPLVHTWARERPQMSTAEQAVWCQAASTTLAHCILLPPLGSNETDEELRRDLLPHVNHVRKCEEDIRARIGDNQKVRNRPWPVLAPSFDRRQAIQAAKFSLVYSQCGLWEAAEKLQLQVKEFVCRMLGKEHPAARAIMLALSNTYWQQARTNEAADLQDQVLQACVKSLGPDHRQTLKAMDTLGASRCFQGRFNEAKQLHERAIEGLSKTVGAGDEDTLLAMDNLGRVLWRYFRYEEAKDLHLQAVAGLKKVRGPAHLTTLTAMESLAMTYLELGGDLLIPAHELMTKVLETRTKKLGKEQPYTLLAICNLARIKSALNQHEEAERLMRAALPIAERNLGENHFGHLAGRVYLAQVLVRQKRYDEAEDIFTNVIQRQRYTSAARDDGEHPDRILAMYYLLQCYQLHGKIEDAIRMCDELSESISTIGGQGLGLAHPFAKRLVDKRKELQAAITAVAAVEPAAVPVTAKYGTLPVAVQK